MDPCSTRSVYDPLNEMDAVTADHFERIATLIQLEEAAAAGNENARRILQVAAEQKISVISVLVAAFLSGMAPIQPLAYHSEAVTVASPATPALSHTCETALFDLSPKVRQHYES